MTEPAERAGCGTYPGYQTHKRRGEAACPECLAANAAYARQWRAAAVPNEAAAARARSDRRARGRALTRLARAHRAEFLRMYQEELAKAGRR